MKGHFILFLQAAMTLTSMCSVEKGWAENDAANWKAWPTGIGEAHGMLKLPRSIRLDPSDTFVFERVAEPGECVVSGAFVFSDFSDLTALGPKQRRAFRSGFLGVDSLGWSTLAIVAEATEADRQRAVDRLTDQMLLQFGAPELTAAREKADEEVAFAISLCDHPPQTLFAVHRTLENDGIRESFRTLKPRQPIPGADRLHAYARAFAFYEVDSNEQAADEIDLVGLIGMNRE
jgi:hypothetical protein